MAAEAQWEPITLLPSMVCDGEMPLQMTSEARLGLSCAIFRVPSDPRTPGIVQMRLCMPMEAGLMSRP